jgi:hypothetical protein
LSCLSEARIRIGLTSLTRIGIRAPASRVRTAIRTCCPVRIRHPRASARAVAEFRGPKKLARRHASDRANVSGEVRLISVSEVLCEPGGADAGLASRQRTAKAKNRCELLRGSTHRSTETLLEPVLAYPQGRAIAPTMNGPATSGLRSRCPPSSTNRPLPGRKNCCRRTKSDRGAGRFSPA